MKIKKINPKREKAQAILEFAIVLPVLLLVVYGLIETGRLLFVFSSVNNATRQAARYGSTSGVGPNGVPRYQDCDGIRNAAENSDFLNAFDANASTDFIIEYDNGPGTTPYATCSGSTSGVTPSTGDRITVRVNADFDAIVPNIVPFISRTVAGGNPITAESSRTLLLTISIKPPKEDTTTTITSDTPDPSEIGSPVTVSVLVTANTTPTGTVNISGADSNCTITLSNGQGSCVVVFTSLGLKSITASYVGDDKHNPSSDTESHTVVPATTTTVITADTPEPSLTGGTVTVAVEVTSAWGVPSGTVDITGADTNCTITLSGGQGNCNVNFTSSGTKLLTATYNGDATHDLSIDTELHEVVPPVATVTTIMSDSPDPSAIGQSVAVTVAVTGSTTPSGTVAITGADTNCSITLSGGTGSCNVVFNSIGNKTLTATYTPDTPLHSTSSDTEAHSVQLPPTVTTITADTPDPSAQGQAVAVTVTVTGGSTTPSGTVAITGANTNCTVTLAGGTGSCNVVFNSAGPKTLTAVYSGDATHGASNDTEPHTVASPAIPNCDTLSSATNLSVLRMTAGNMTIDINNPFSVTLQVSAVFVKWNHDKGHQTGDDKTLELRNATLGGVTIWNGNAPGPDTTINVISGGSIPANSTSTLAFIFQQTFDRWDNTEVVEIFFDNPGCGSVTLTQTVHE